MSDDLIRRDDAIDAVWKSYDYNDAYPNERPIIDRDIRLIPSVEPKRGEWVQGTERQTIIGAPEGELRTIYALRCSYCNKEFGTLANDYNFCPNCGASMKEREGE